DIPHFSLSTGSVKVITIYLSLWNVHVNRVPISGQVTYLDHQQGCFYPAFNNRSSKKNEYTVVGITGEMGKVFIKQIAGTFARRIVCRLQIDEQVRQGERFGMIKFGSRIELYLPYSVVLKVFVGDRIRGGESIIAEKT
ncbi:phosphatidylserine decarboxylase, partial [bacterium]|nr:phosphatidylserine decarboxylase [bacterium]